MRPEKERDVVPARDLGTVLPDAAFMSEGFQLRVRTVPHTRYFSLPEERQLLVMWRGWYITEYVIDMSVRYVDDLVGCVVIDTDAKAIAFLRMSTRGATRGIIRDRLGCEIMESGECEGCSGRIDKETMAHVGWKPARLERAGEDTWRLTRFIAYPSEGSLFLDTLAKVTETVTRDGERSVVSREVLYKGRLRVYEPLAM